MSGDDHIIQGGRITGPDSAFPLMPGFRNHHSTEAVAGALPIGQNAPQSPPLGLYAEQLSGTAFTAPKADNLRSWVYRIRPSVRHIAGLTAIEGGLIRTAPCRDENILPAGQLRWRPAGMPERPVDLIDGMATMASCGDAHLQAGMAAHIYRMTAPMTDRVFCNADGEMLFVPERNGVRFITEFGVLAAEPGEIVVIPRGVKFRADPAGPDARGYICENYGRALTLPERGPIGANALAGERDFLYPSAAYEDIDGPHEIIFKSGGKLFAAEIAHSPLDVVAWHGNYAPYKYDTARFAPVGAVRIDHPDPSIYTVLTSPSDTAGIANVDFVIFPERWLVAENTFRPPWYHMNAMSEFMGLVTGVYDAKPGGFVPGGASLHNAMLPHGPDAEAWERASKADLVPQKLADTLAFMFETRYALSPTGYACDPALLDQDYASCWAGLERHFPADE